MYSSRQPKQTYPSKQQHHKKYSSKILNECQKVINQLKTQLQQALKHIKQKDQIIQILSQEKQFYEIEYKKNNQNTYVKLKQQLNFNQSLVKALKQHNKELGQKNSLLAEENSELWKKVEEKDEILKVVNVKLEELQKEKSKLERQWGETLKCVKRKIFQLQRQACSSKQQKNHAQTKSKNNDNKRNQSKENLKKGQNKNIPAKQKYMITQLKVKQILKQIDQKLLNYDFLDMIQSKNIRKNMENQFLDQENKQNVNNMNLVKNLFPDEKFKLNQDKAGRKVSIMKLSQLCLRQNQDSKSGLYRY